MDELWAELGVDPGRPQPAAIDLEDWLFDSDASPDRRQTERRFVHGHLLAPGDLRRTDWHARCAQPPYDCLPVPRAAIPEGVILSREADAWIDEKEIKDVALPLYEGRMIGQFDFSQKGWISGKGRGAKWRDIPWERKQIEPQYLMAEVDYHQGVKAPDAPKLALMAVGSATNERTVIGANVRGLPASHALRVLTSSDSNRVGSLTALLNSFVFDYSMRLRLAGSNLDFHILEQNLLPAPSQTRQLLDDLVARLRSDGPGQAVQTLSEAPAALMRPNSVGPTAGTTLPRSEAERTRLLSIVDATVALFFGIENADLREILRQCDLPSSDNDMRSNPDLRSKGFWRVDKDKPPELRHTVLAQVAYADLQRHVAAAGNRGAGIRSFLDQNYGEGWLLPETLRLADYNLGHDDRAQHHQPVASELGPRFYDWQLAQTPEEAWNETRLHARNLLGEPSYCRLLAELKDASTEQHSNRTAQHLSEVAEEGHPWDDCLDGPAEEPNPRQPTDTNQSDLFD